MSAAAPAPTGGGTRSATRAWFAPEHVAQFGAPFSEIGIGADIAAQAIAGERRVNDGANPSGRGVEHEDAIGEDERLVDAVGDEDDRRASARPYRKEVLLQLLARLRVERAEGL